MRISGLILASLVASAPLSALPIQWLGVLSGVQMQMGDSRGANNAVVVGTSYGIWFTSFPSGNWGVNATLHQANIGASNASPYAPGGTQTYSSVTALYNFYSTSMGVLPVKCYIKAGPGFVNVAPNWSNYWGSTTATTRTTLIMGAGAQLHYRFTPTMGVIYGIEAQMQSFYPSAPFTKNYHEWPVLVTVAYTW